MIISNSFLKCVQRQKPIAYYRTLRPNWRQIRKPWQVDTHEIDLTTKKDPSMIKTR